MMDRLERLLRTDLPFFRKQEIMRARQPAQNLMLLGLPTTAVRRILDDDRPCTIKGTPRGVRAADLRGHYFTRKHRDPVYAFKDKASAAQEASKTLHNQRSKMVVALSRMTDSSKRPTIPLPGCTKGKQNTTIRGPRVTIRPAPSLLSYQVDAKDIEIVSEEDSEEMLAFYRQLCELGGNETNVVDSDHNTYIGGSTDDEVEAGVEVTGSSMEEPDDYDIEMAKAFEEHNSGLPISDPVNAEQSGRQMKRERETDLSPGQVDQNEKRRKLDIDTNSSQVSRSRLRKKVREGRGGNLQPHNLFCRSSTLAAVFQAALAVGTLEAPQVDTSDASRLTALDLELLGEDPSDSEQEDSSVSEDPMGVIGEGLYPLVSHDDLRVAYAAANLIEIHQGNSDVLELEPADREALKKAFGTSDDSQSSVPEAEMSSPFVAIPRTARFSDRCSINRSFVTDNGYKIKRHDKPTGPSGNFKSFFATRRLRKNILRQNEESWNEEDTSFVLSGKEIEEPGADFGAELVAKCLLDGQKSPLRDIVRDSQMSMRRRQNRESRHPRIKVLSRKDERKIAQIQNSGLSVKMAEPKAGEKKHVSKAKVKKSVSKAKGKKSGS